ncbi:MAG: toll/interleukin-1 receptor domain-containing protein [Lachnospiraceae bacterium]|nr:toll/interleukin-1 receptor domain-containing protein [Ruminococcus sp.]MCM1276972.1 toll/interleukin-1 receptor domain-containing protein [Lachnospiraceae bacterium]
MKKDLETLIDRSNYIESKFSLHDSLYGGKIEFIYDDLEFTEWLEAVKFELQDIYDRTKDEYVWNIINPNGVINKFNGKHTNERQAFVTLKTSLQLILDSSGKYYPDCINEIGGTHAMKKPMLFISHSSADLKYVEPLVELLADIGLNNNTMFCSSVPDYHIPLDNDIYEYLRNLFTGYDIHVIFILSQNYYKSAACLNEMGAAWALQKKYSTILLPGFDFPDIKGAVNPTKIALKLDGKIDDVKMGLGELKKIITEEFGISVPDNRWEKKRNMFIETVANLTDKEE